MKRWFRYAGNKAREISFPLGGIGTGCIGLGGNGRFVEWEIFNRPNKGGLNGFSHFAVKAEAGGRVLDARVLQGDLPPPYTGMLSGPLGSNFGFGPPRATLAGLPHFRSAVFRAAFPFAEVDFTELGFPGRVTLRAFNPFIPLNAADSSLPAAFFEIIVHNPTRRRIDYTVAFTIKNPLPPGSHINRFTRAAGAACIHLRKNGLAADDPTFGDLTVATDASGTSRQEYWFRGSWFDELAIFWRDFTTFGRLRNRTYAADDGAQTRSAPQGRQDHATLAAHVRVAPGETGRARFVLAWSFPNCINYWNPEKPAGRARRKGQGIRPGTWKNWYATVFADSSASATYALQNWERLETESRRFSDALLGSTLPAAALDAISANLSVLKSPTVLRLTDGSLYGWEGCHPASGSCEGTCTHVWNYTYAVPFLFPRLERSMRELDYRYNLAPDGRMPFRLQLPLGRERTKSRSCADGQFGGVIKTYREWRVSGDTEWLRRLWPAVKLSLEYAWSPDNPDRWDPDRRGVLTGRQHHTLDMELFGPNSWLTGFYLAALKAAAEMADALGEHATAKDYRALFAKGKRWADRHLFNGRYYHQVLNLKDRRQLEPFRQSGVAPASTRSDVFALYWNEEHGEIKYQIAEGCGIDQVVAQWHADLCGLGDIFDRRQVRSALRSIYRYNFKRSMTAHVNPCRIYCLNDEAGTVMFAWPPGARRPIVPIPYAEETMHGFEYQAASHLIREGFLREGLDMVRAVRDRYDGERRNPWNELECGSNYARSMASYALLLAYCGFEFDMRAGRLGFDPRLLPEKGFRCFWAVEDAWGTFTLRRKRVTLEVLSGRLDLKALRLPFLRSGQIQSAAHGSEAVPFTFLKGELRFEPLLALAPGRPLVLRLR